MFRDRPQPGPDGLRVESGSDTSSSLARLVRGEIDLVHITPDQAVCMITPTLFEKPRLATLLVATIPNDDFIHVNGGFTVEIQQGGVALVHSLVPQLFAALSAGERDKYFYQALFDKAGVGGPFIFHPYFCEDVKGDWRRYLVNLTVQRLINQGVSELRLDGERNNKYVGGKTTAGEFFTPVIGTPPTQIGDWSFSYSLRGLHLQLPKTPEFT